MKIRASLTFNADVLVGSVLADEDHPDLHLHFNVGRAPAKIFVSPEDLECLSPEARQHLPTAILQGHAVLRVFTLEFDVELPSAVTESQLRSGTRTSEMIGCLIDLSVRIRQAHERFREALTASLKLGALPSHALQTSGLEFLKECNARYLADAEWRPLLPSDGMHFGGHAQLVQPLDRQTWLTSVRDALESSERVPNWHRLLASSVDHLARGEYRLATIDAVTALEAMKTLFAPALVKLPRFSDLGVEWIAGNMTKSDLQPVAKRCLPILRKENLLTVGDEGVILQGIKRRNALIHDDPGAHVERGDAELLIAALDRLANALEGHIDPMSKHHRYLGSKSIIPIFTKGPLGR